MSVSLGANLFPNELEELMTQCCKQATLQNRSIKFRHMTSSSEFIEFVSFSFVVKFPIESHVTTIAAAFFKLLQGCPRRTQWETEDDAFDSDSWA